MSTCFILFQDCIKKKSWNCANVPLCNCILVSLSFFLFFFFLFNFQYLTTVIPYEKKAGTPSVEDLQILTASECLNIIKALMQTNAETHND